jgi:hypothetical protein
MWNNEWVIGHVDEGCSPFIHHKDANLVLKTFMELKRSGTFEARFFTPISDPSNA